MSDQTTTPPAPESDEDIRDLFIVNEMKNSYLNYAMSVIVSRALPDVRDGLKPSQRRILYAMRDLNLTPGRGHRKSAKIVGETMGNYHPHGDQAIYPTLVRMAQPWNSRYPLVDPQGNFGSIDGDPPAAMRYTEAKMTKMAVDLMEDINRDTVDFQPNFDETKEEPVVFPAKIPNLLCNGSSGIAVGMATSIPPHNLTEVCDALLYRTEHPNASVDEIMEHLPGPDFPTGGTICGQGGVREAYRTGRGKVTLRGKVYQEIEEGQSPRLVVTEIPYGIQKKKIIEDIADCVNEERIEGIRDIRDETDREGIRIVVEVKKNWNADLVENQLFKFTDLQKTVSMIFLALVDQQPEVLSIQEMLDHFLDHRREIIRRRTRYKLENAKEEVHRLEGLVVAVDNLDEVIEMIRGSESTDEAGRKLREEFDLTERQSDAILRMRLQRLTGLERAKLRERLEELREQIEEYQLILRSDEKITEIIQDEIREVREDHGDDRKTTIGEPVDGFDMEDLIAEEETVVLFSRDGYSKRMEVDQFSNQHRGGVGIIAAKTKEEDEIEHLFVTSTHDYMLLFTNTGQVYWQKMYGVPKLSRNSRGRALVNLLNKDREERVSAALSIRDLDRDGYLLMVTRNGWVKKTPLEDYSRPMKGGIRGVRLEEGDQLAGVIRTSGDDEVLVATKQGQAIKFHEEDVSPTGRVTRGVIGIRLADDDEVVGVSPVRSDATLLTVSESGYGKRSEFDKYRQQTRGGKGVINMKTIERNGPVASVRTVYNEDEIMLATAGGMAVRIPVEEIPVQGRNTAGVKVMSVKDDDRVASIGRIIKEDDTGDGGTDAEETADDREEAEAETGS